jgi:drug/metabolite transporter (DMT)-like permease
MLQKTLSGGTLTAAGTTFARFFYSAPLVALILCAYLIGAGRALPDLSLALWAWGVFGGVSQILATMCVVALFQQRNFAVGTTFAKTEVIQTVLVGLVLLGEGVTWAAFGCILIGTIGVLLLSDPPGGRGAWLSRITNRAVGLGLLSGLLFAFSGVSYRAASLELAVDEPLLRAGITLAAVTMMQMLGMLVWLKLYQPGEIARVWAARRTAGFVGLTSMAGSYCWFRRGCAARDFISADARAGAEDVPRPRPGLDQS